MSAMIDGFVLRRESDYGESVFYSVDETAGVESIFVPADYDTSLKVYLTEEEAEGALYEAKYLYEKEGVDTTDLENTMVVPYVDYYDEIEERLLQVEVG